MTTTWTPHALIAWGGSLGNPALDIWTNTLKAVAFDGDGVQVPLTQAEQQEVADSLVDPLSVWVAYGSAGTSTHSGAVSLEWIKVNMIAATGKYMYQDTTINDLDPAVLGTGNPQDWRVSLAVTLRSTLKRGRAHVGRFYPPATPLSPTGTTPYINSTQQTTYLSQAVGLLDKINNIGTSTGKNIRLALVSPGESAVGLEPEMQLVDSAEVDAVLDTQRRRTNRVPRSAMNTVLQA